MNTKENRKKAFKIGEKDGSNCKIAFGAGLPDTHSTWQVDAYRRGWMKARSGNFRLRKFGPHRIHGEAQITTTNRYYTLRYWHELPKRFQEAAVAKPKDDTNSFIIFHGQFIDLGDFSRIVAPEHIQGGKFHPSCHMDNKGEFDDWDAILHTSLSTGLLIRYQRDSHGDMNCEKAVIGEYKYHS